MRTTQIINYLFYLVLVVHFCTSCQEFLDKAPEAVITEGDIFSTFASFQGFIETNYNLLNDFNQGHAQNGMYFGGEAYGGWGNNIQTMRGNYWGVIGPNAYNHFKVTYGATTPASYGEANTSSGRYWGIWGGGWQGIRYCNVALRKIHLLVDATQEEKDLIEGQAYFFRGYFHGNILKNFGGMPYVDTVFSASDELKLPRLSYHECTERVIEDLDRAIPLLPKDWEETGPGSQRPGANAGRITRGTALAYKQNFLLWAGSPLPNGTCGNGFVYNVDYCKRAAAAGWEMIKLANEGYHELMPWEQYYRNFHNKNDGTTIWTKETILQRMNYRFGDGTERPYGWAKRICLPVYLGGQAVAISNPNQTIIDRFEMADGTRYKVEYDYDDNKRWENRDPRFGFNFVVDREKVGANVRSVWKGYMDFNDPQARPTNVAFTPYLNKKFIGYNVNGIDRQTTKFQQVNPLMRFAQVYLDYAEAVTAAYGPTGTAPGSNLTAVDAVNIVRARAGMPPVTAAADGYNSFMDLVWNERIVEFMWESHYWYDIRRWYVAHLPEHREYIDLQFDKDWTYFNRVEKFYRVHDNPKHYWLPIYQDQVLLYKDFYQNPGW